MAETEAVDFKQAAFGRRTLAHEGKDVMSTELATCVPEGMIVEIRPIKDVEVQGRIREDHGDIEGLMRSIKDVGLLHPVVILPDGRLIAGARRLKACRKLKHTTIAANVWNGDPSDVALLTAERDENTCRLEMSQLEKVKLGMKIEGAIASERHVGRPPANSDQRSELGPLETETRHIVGKTVGLGGTTYGRGKAVLTAAKEGDPVAKEQVAALRAGETKINTAYNKVQGIVKPPPKSFALDSERNQQLANKAKERFETVLGTLSAFEDGMVTFPFERALAVSDAEEVKEWIGQLDEVKKGITKIIKSLKEGSGSC